MNKSATAAIEADIQRIAASITGTVGVAARRLDGVGARIAVNGDEPFPMASTFKIAIACAVLSKIDTGELTLGGSLEVRPDQMVQSDILAANFIHPGVSLSVHNLLEIMLTLSDNSATDVMVAAAGGPARVTDWLRAQGIGGQRVDRDTAGIIGDYLEFHPGSFSEQLADARENNPRLDEILNNPKASFDDDPRDTSSPLAMADLIQRIFSGEALSEPSTAALTTILERCRTGPGRLKGRLPPETVVAHKTGTIGGTVNDVGVIALPGDGKVVIAVFIKKSASPVEKREAAIADIARSVRDFYLFGDMAP